MLQAILKHPSKYTGIMGSCVRSFDRMYCMICRCNPMKSFRLSNIRVFRTVKKLDTKRNKHICCFSIDIMITLNVSHHTHIACCVYKIIFFVLFSSLSRFDMIFKLINSKDFLGTHTHTHTSAVIEATRTIETKKKEKKNSYIVIVNICYVHNNNSRALISSLFIKRPVKPCLMEKKESESE